jgi:neutral amino acid transport system permease protein
MAAGLAGRSGHRDDDMDGSDHSRSAAPSPRSARSGAVRLCGACLVVFAALVVSASLTMRSAGAQPPPTLPDDPDAVTSTTTPGRLGESDDPPGEPGGVVGGPAVAATLTAAPDGEPLEGVVLVVEQDGEFVGSAESGSDGGVVVPLPAPGTYEVRLDLDTLPDGVAIAEGAPEVLTPTVRDAERRLIFRLVAGEGATVGPSAFERLGSLTASGMRLGLVIALAAVGLSLIYGTTGLTNFAHGEMVTFGALATWYLQDPGGLGLPVVVAAVVAVALSGAFGASFELGVWRPLRRRGMPILSQMVVSIGLAFALRYLFAIVYGAASRQYSQYAAQAPTLRLGPLDLRPKDVVVTVVAALALIAIGVFLERSRLGTAIRAVSDNRDLSVASGIDDRRVVLMVWILAGSMAGLGGLMLGATDNVAWNMGQQVLLIMFAAVVLGGLGTAFGAMVGGLIVGIVSDVSTFWLDADLKIVVALATLVVVLLVRPQGVFGVRARTA